MIDIRDLGIKGRGGQALLPDLELFVGLFRVDSCNSWIGLIFVVFELITQLDKWLTDAPKFIGGSVLGARWRQVASCDTVSLSVLPAH